MATALADNYFFRNRTATPIAGILNGKKRVVFARCGVCMRRIGGIAALLVAKLPVIHVVAGSYGQWAEVNRLSHHIYFKIKRTFRFRINGIGLRAAATPIQGSDVHHRKHTIATHHSESMGRRWVCTRVSVAEVPEMRHHGAALIVGIGKKSNHRLAVLIHPRPVR